MRKRGRPVIHGRHPRFELGDIVEWESHANGKTTRKTGMIVFIVKPGFDVISFVREDPHFRIGYYLNNLGHGKPRRYVSYLVAVRSGKRVTSKFRLYWPRGDVRRSEKRSIYDVDKERFDSGVHRHCHQE